jgi:hypothetical protein
MFELLACSGMRSSAAPLPLLDAVSGLLMCVQEEVQRGRPRDGKDWVHLHVWVGADGVDALA